MECGWFAQPRISILIWVSLERGEDDGFDAMFL